MPVAQTRTRRLLIVLAILVLSLAISRYAILVRPSMVLMSPNIADEHAYMKDRIGDYIRGGARYVPAYDDGPYADAKQLLDYHTRMRMKYRIAAWCPWAEIPPDPPVPTL